MIKLSIALRSLRRERSKGNIYALKWFLGRFYLRFLRRRWPFLAKPTQADINQRVTIVIPVVEKDAHILKYCLEGVRLNFRNKIEAVWVVAPDSILLREIAGNAGALFIHEDKILPAPANELRTRGWVLQQLIKLNACNHVKTEWYLVLDSDTVFLRPQAFFRDGKAMIRYSDQYELLYNRSLQLILGHDKRFPVSFVTHHMMFHTEAVKEMLILFEHRFGCSWWLAILNELDKGHPVSFSEFELYGHFVLSRKHWRRQICLEYWNGLDLSTLDVSSLEQIAAQVDGRKNSVSFHQHTQ
jgi:hypothetical protein